MTSAWIPLKNVAETSHSQVELFDSVISRFITMEMGKNAIDQIEQSTLKQWIPGLSCHKNRNDIMIDKAILDPLLRSYNLPFFFNMTIFLWQETESQIPIHQQYSLKGHSPGIYLLFSLVTSDDMRLKWFCGLITFASTQLFGSFAVFLEESGRLSTGYWTLVSYFSH